MPDFNFLITDSSANVVEQLTYDSFGNHVASSRTRYTYTGRERDADTDLCATARGSMIHKLGDSLVKIQLG